MVWKRGRVTVRSVTRDTSTDGLFIATAEPIAMNQVMDLTVVLPSGPVSLLAVSRRRVRDDAGAGLGVTIFAMEPLERARWNAHCRRS